MLTIYSNRSIRSVVCIQKCHQAIRKKIIKPGEEHAGDKFCRKAAEMCGNPIMRRVRGVKQRTTTKVHSTLLTIKEEITDMILNSLISKQGL